MTPLEWVKNIISVCAAGIDRENEQRTQGDAEKLAEIYQNYNTEENIKKRSYQSANTDKPGYRYEFKNKNNKKAGGLVYGTFVDKNKVIIFSYEYKAGRDEEHESEYEYLMSDTEYGYYD